MVVNVNTKIVQVDVTETLVLNTSSGILTVNIPEGVIDSDVKDNIIIKDKEH